jgi:hypothetical protein
VTVRKQSDGSWSYVGNGCVLSAPPAVTANMVRDQVVRLVPSAAVGLAPHDATLVNIETVMWVDAPSQRTLAPITLLGRRVIVRLALDHVDWSFGDGQTGGSTGPGKAYDPRNDPCRAVECPGYFGHTYRKTGTVTVAATASWRATFTVDGGAAITIPGTVAAPTARARLAVKEARAVLVPNPGQH